MFSRFFRFNRWPKSTLIALIAVFLIQSPACKGEDENKSTVCLDTEGSGLNVTISGVLQYEDRTYDEKGFTGTVLKPIRRAMLEVVRCSDSEVLASGVSLEDGSYTMTFTNMGSAGIYLRVLANDTFGTVKVQNSDQSLYAVVSNIVDDGASTRLQVDLNASVDLSGGVFNILDVFLEAADFVKSLSGGFPPLITAIWEPGSCDGTFYSSPLDTIHILGGCPNDTDEYDDDVLLHEYGHFIASVYSKDDSSGGDHFLTENDQDIRLSWSEGWGNFFTSAVRNDPSYVDTSGDVAALSFELEGPSSPLIANFSSEVIYTTSELSVATVLWDIVDSTPDESLSNAGGMDTVSDQVEAIWEVFSLYLCSACVIEDVSFEDFWDGWLAQGHGLENPLLVLTQDRLMALSEDSHEPNVDTSTATAITVNDPAQDHTLYSKNDMDYLNFTGVSGQQYTLETIGLTNGADTYLELLDSGGEVILENDNTDGKSYSAVCAWNFLANSTNCPLNDQSTLASKILYTPASGGLVNIRVKRSSMAPPSSGVYGSYQIRVTSPP